MWEEFGPLAASVGFASVLLAPWLQRGMKDLYWCLWTWLLPLLAALWLCHCTRVRGKTPRGCWPLVAAACMVRCMCGFEFITTFLILCEIPLCYAAAKAYFVRRDPHGALVCWAAPSGGVSALGGVTARWRSVRTGMALLRQRGGRLAEHDPGRHGPRQPDGRRGAGT